MDPPTGETQGLHFICKTVACGGAVSQKKYLFKIKSETLF